MPTGLDLFWVLLLCAWLVSPQAFGNQVTTPIQVLKERIQLEQACRSGSARLSVEVSEENFQNPLVTPYNVPIAELRECTYIDYTSRDPYMWQAIAYRADGTIVRSAHCDGIWISSSEGTVWDAEYGFRTPPSGLSVTRDIALWPYTLASKLHLFSFTLGRAPHCEEYTGLGDTHPGETDAPLDTDSCRFSFELFVRDFQSVVVDTCKGDVPVSRDYGIPPESSVCYGMPILVTDNLWLPRECRVSIRDEDGLHAVWSTELLLEESHFDRSIAPETFRVDVRPGMQTIGGGSGWQKRQLKQRQRQSLGQIPREVWLGFVHCVPPVFLLLGIVLILFYWRKRYSKSKC